ncbi:MAG: hypothetical protein ABI947_12430 [Chloroflexota bacterium]
MAISNSSEPLKVCFVMMPFGAELRDYVEQVFEFIITEAVEPFDYQLVRADQISDIGALAPQVIQHLTQDGLVIADLTRQDPQVFYGLAIRHASRRPIIHLSRDGEPALPEFSGIPLVKVNVSSARDTKRARQELIGHIEHLEETDQPQDTPISRAVKRKLLEQSESLLDQRAAEMLKMLDTIRSSVLALDERTAQPENFLPTDLMKTLDTVRTTVTGLDERMAQPESILPHDHIISVMKHSGILMSREEIDRVMSDIFAYAEDAKNILDGVNPQLLGMSKGLHNVRATLISPTPPTDLIAISDKVEQYASGAINTQNTIGEAVQKLDSALGALSQFYRNLNKLSL